ncbi:hypothetical protein [Pyxidicoccus xibeiensis]|uniref:hypothetical protein n=1 Tax=Pyxidicoccus xibeiensis TaxID=2906759 RepID=UPI0020A7BEFE|nr:hypothetical protein [Pyxidicoccus xibeiensis]MCP3138594.1 hypothetical protein [Pyxidicoccus xibeiensis]
MGGPSSVGSGASTSHANPAAEAARRAEEARQRAEAARRAAEAARKAAEAAQKAAEAAQKAAEAARKAQADAQKATAAAKQKAEQPGQSPEGVKTSKAEYEAAKKAEQAASAQVAHVDKALQAATEKAADTAKQAQGAMREANTQATRESKPVPFSQKDLDSLLPKANPLTSSFGGTQRGGDFDKLFGPTPTGPQASSLMTEDANDGQANCLDVAADWVNKASPEIRARSEMVFLEDQRPGKESQTGHVVVRQGEKVFDPTTQKSYASMGDYLKEQPHYKEAGSLTANKARAIFDTPPGSPERADALAKANVPPGLQKMMVADNTTQPKTPEQRYEDLAKDPKTQQTLKELGIQNANDFKAYTDKLAQNGPADLGGEAFDNVKDKKAAQTIMYEALASNEKTAKALEKFEIKNGEDLAKFSKTVGDQTKGEKTADTEKLKLGEFEDKDALTKLLRGAGAVSEDWEQNAILSSPAFTKAISEGKKPEEAKENTLGKFELTEAEITNLGKYQEGRKALRKLMEPWPDDPEKKAAMAAEKATAFFTLVEQGKHIFTPDQLQNKLGAIGAKAFEKAPGAFKSTGELVAAFADPEATPAKKLKAIAGFAKDMGAAAVEFPALRGKFAEMFSKAEGPLRTAGAVFTLLDSKAKWDEKVHAGLQLAGEFPGAAKDIKELAQLLRSAGVPDAEGILQAGQNLTMRTMRDLPPEVANKLTAEQKTALSRVVGKADPAELSKVLQKVSDPAALDGVLKQIEASPDKAAADKFLKTAAMLDPQAANEALKNADLNKQLAKIGTDLGDNADLPKLLANVKSADGLTRLATKLTSLGEGEDAGRLLKVLGSVKGDQLDEVLKNADTLKHLSKMAKDITDPNDLAALAKTIGNMDAKSLDSFAKIAGQIPADELSKGLKMLAPVLEKLDSRVIGQAFGLLEKTLGFFGKTIDPDIALKVFKGLGKMIPGLGAVPGIWDAGKLAKESADLHGKDKDLGYLALTGAKLNGLDAIGGVILDLTGVGAAVDLAAGAVLGVAELALDIGLSSEKKKMEEAKAQGKDYDAPDWVKVVNLTAAIATAPAGIAELVTYYGKDSLDLVKWGIEKGGQLAEKLKGIVDDVAKKVLNPFD